MRLARLFASLFFVVALLGSLHPARAQEMSAPLSDSSAIESSAELQEFRVTIRHLLNQGEFDQLDQLAQKLRSEKTRINGGFWKLQVLYRVLAIPAAPRIRQNDSDWEAHIARLKKWAAQNPESVTARIALGEAYLAYGWKARGHGYSSTVSPEAFKLFKERIGLADSALNNAANLSTKCPEWYSAMQHVALVGGWDKQRARSLFEQAIAFEPEFHGYYVSYANYLLPQWHGPPGEIPQFASDVAATRGGQQGSSIYYEIAAALDWRAPKAPWRDMSWSQIKDGFAAHDQLYGSTNFQLNQFAYMAIQNKDKAAAQQAFQRIGNDWAPQIWNTPKEFEVAKAFANAAP